MDLNLFDGFGKRNTRRSRDCYMIDARPSIAERRAPVVPRSRPGLPKRVSQLLGGRVPVLQVVKHALKGTDSRVQTLGMWAV